MKDSISLRRLPKRFSLVSDLVLPISSRSFAGLDLQVHGAQQLVDGLGAHPGVEFVAVLLDGVQIGLVGQQLAALAAWSCRDRSTTKDSKYSTRSMSRRVMSSSRPMREGSDFRNQMCATGLASSM